MAWGEKAPRAALELLGSYQGKPENVVDWYTDLVVGGWSHVDAPAAWDWGVQSIRDEALCFELAERHRLTIYDSAYLALAP